MALSPLAAITLGPRMVIVTVARAAQPIALLKVLLAHPEVAELTGRKIVISASRALPIARQPTQGVLDDARCINDALTP
jgi:hypothetical protein